MVCSALAPIVSFEYATRPIRCSSALHFSRRLRTRSPTPRFSSAATSPSNRRHSGFALGAGLLIVAFEFEYGEHVEDLAEAAP